MSVPMRELLWEFNHLATLEETAEKIDGILEDYCDRSTRGQILASVIVLLERIEQLEKRLDANGIYQ